MHVFAQGQYEPGTPISLAIVLGLLGAGLCRLTNRMLALRRRIWHWAVGLGIVTGVIFCLSALASSKPPIADDLLSSIMVGGMVGLFSTMVWYLVVAVIAFCYQYTLAPIFRFFARCRQRAAESRRRWQEEARQRQKQRDYERGAPERARVAANQVSAQKRREDARASCELLYSLHAVEIRDRFPRADLDEFLKKYMTDKHDPEFVEERAEQMKTIIEQHLQKIESPKKKMSLEDLARWYQETRKQIDASLIEQKHKNTQIVQLNSRYQDLVQEAMEEMQP